MIHTVFHTPNEAGAEASELLEHTWSGVAQPGELVRLVSAAPRAPLASSPRARVFRAVPWSPHPYTGDAYAGYDRPAALLEWVFEERVDGTVLILEPDCLFSAPIPTELEPGRALGAPWALSPRPADGPFGLGEGFAFLDRFCVDRSLSLDPITLPVLVHARDLRRIAPRWLELTSILRAEGVADPERLAYVIAAAEAEVPHDPRGLESSLQRPAAAEAPALLAPCRREGVREARLLDRVILEIPGRAETMALDPAAAEVWRLCDGRRTLAEIAAATGGPDVRATACRLATAGALALTVTPHAPPGASSTARSSASAAGRAPTSKRRPARQRAR